MQPISQSEEDQDQDNRSKQCKDAPIEVNSAKITNIVRSMYVDTRAKYRLGDIETDWVKSERGVRQECILSPILFSLYTEELAARMRRLNAGVRVGNDRIGATVCG